MSARYGKGKEIKASRKVKIKNIKIILSSFYTNIEQGNFFGLLGVVETLPDAMVTWEIESSRIAELQPIYDSGSVLSGPITMIYAKNKGLTKITAKYHDLTAQHMVNVRPIILPRTEKEKEEKEKGIIDSVYDTLKSMGSAIAGLGKGVYKRVGDNITSIGNSIKFVFDFSSSWSKSDNPEKYLLDTVQQMGNQGLIEHINNLSNPSLLQFVNHVKAGDWEAAGYIIGGPITDILLIGIGTLVSKIISKVSGLIAKALGRLSKYLKNAGGKIGKLFKGVFSKGGRGAKSIFNKGKAVFNKFNVKDAYVKPKHLSTSGGNGAKFIGSSKAEAEAILKDVMTNGKITSIVDDGVSALGNSKFEITISAGKTIGTKGETFIKIILSEDGGMLSAYPVK